MSVLPFKQPEKNDPHLAGKATCAACRHNWIAVAPVGFTLIECPSCHTMKGRMINECLPAKGKIWTCPCGCDIFHITDDSAMCINCGLRQEF